MLRRSFFHKVKIASLLLSIILNSEYGLLAQNTPNASSGATNSTDLSRATMTVVGGDYVLRPNDVVSVVVFGEPDLAMQDRIVADGTIMMPLVGRIKISGQSSVIAAETIRRALAADYLVNPQVSLSITEAARETFTVIGKVVRPGSYVLPPGGKLTMLEAIGMAGGFAPSASVGKISVKRTQGDREVILKVDGKSQVNSARELSFEIQPGDVINVPTSLF